MTYTTVEDIESLIGDVVRNRTFATSSRPSLTEVGIWIDQIQSELRLELYSAGFIARGNDIPVDDFAFGWVKRVATVGVSARILQSKPLQSLMTPETEDAAADRAVNFDREYHRGLNKIRTRQILITEGSRPQHNLRTGTSGRNNECKKPFFRRGQFDHPELGGYGYLDRDGNPEFYPGQACSCCPSDSGDSGGSTPAPPPAVPVTIYAWAQSGIMVPTGIPSVAVMSTTSSISLSLIADGHVFLAQKAGVSDLTMINVSGFGNVLSVFTKGPVTFQDQDGNALEYWYSNLSQRAGQTITYEIVR